MIKKASSQVISITSLSVGCNLQPTLLHLYYTILCRFCQEVFKKYLQLFFLYSILASADGLFLFYPYAHRGFCFPRPYFSLRFPQCSPLYIIIIPQKWRFVKRFLKTFSKIFECPLISKSIPLLLFLTS